MKSKVCPLLGIICYQKSINITSKKTTDAQGHCPSPWERGQGERSVFQSSKN